VVLDVISNFEAKKGSIEAETEGVVFVEHLYSSSDMENDSSVIHRLS
jgi:hypothetical protein